MYQLFGLGIHIFFVEDATFSDSKVIASESHRFLYIGDMSIIVYCRFDTFIFDFQTLEIDAGLSRHISILDKSTSCINL